MGGKTHETQEYIQKEVFQCEPVDPTNMDPELNWEACGYFIDTHVKIDDKTDRGWIPFKLWGRRRSPLAVDPDGNIINEDAPGGSDLSPSQWDALKLLFCNGRVVILKARQLGLTWLCLSIALWHIVFIPGTMVMLFSYREEEAKKLLEKLKDMFRELPWWFKMDHVVDKNTTIEWGFTNGTKVMAFSTESGDGYQANIVIMDEATLVPNLGKLNGRVLPVIKRVKNGQYWMISRANKELPKSYFNNVFRRAMARIRKQKGKGEGFAKPGTVEWRQWMPLFLPWWVAPDSTKESYELEKLDAEMDDGHYDTLYAMSPNSIEEALSPSTSNKRIPQKWILAATKERSPLDISPLAIPDLVIYLDCEKAESYAIGGDPAEGLPTSNNSVLVVVKRKTRELAAIVCGKHTPRALATYAHQLSVYYGGAPILIERLNHGHATILALENLDAWILEGQDERPGWQSGTQGKINLYDIAAEVLHEAFLVDMEIQQKRKKGEGIGKLKRMNILFDHDLTLELMSIERKTLRAPDKHLDDRADGWAMAQVALTLDYADGIIRADYSMF